MLVVDAGVLEGRPDDIKAVLQALQRAMDFYEQSPKEAIAIMARRTGVTADEFRSGLAGAQVVSPRDQHHHLQHEDLLPRSLDLTLQALKEMELLDEDARADKLIDTSVMLEDDEA